MVVLPFAMVVNETFVNDAFDEDIFELTFNFPGTYTVSSVVPNII